MQDSQGQGLQGQDSQGQNREGGRTYYTGLSSIKEGDKVRYYLYNHRGDTVLVTGGDGEIIHNLSYEAYGKATDKLGYPAGSVNIETGGGAGGGESFGRGSGSFPALFVGGAGIRYDVKTNLHYMRFRWFSPDQMRFISKDLLMDENRYAYAGGDPVSYIDATGLKETNVINVYGHEDYGNWEKVSESLKIYRKNTDYKYPIYVLRRLFHHYINEQYWKIDTSFEETEPPVSYYNMKHKEIRNRRQKEIHQALSNFANDQARKNSNNWVDCDTFVKNLPSIREKLIAVSGADDVKFYPRISHSAYSVKWYTLGSMHIWVYIQFIYIERYDSNPTEHFSYSWWFAEANSPLLCTDRRFFPIDFDF